MKEEGKGPITVWKSQLPCFYSSTFQEIVPCWKLSFSGKLFLMINRNNYMCNNWRSISWRYNKLRSILHFRVAKRNINFRWGILNFGITISSKTLGETVGNTTRGSMLGAKVGKTPMRVSIAETVQNHVKGNWTVSILAWFRM